MAYEWNVKPKLGVTSRVADVTPCVLAGPRNQLGRTRIASTVMIRSVRHLLPCLWRCGPRQRVTVRRTASPLSPEQLASGAQRIMTVWLWRRHRFHAVQGRADLPARVVVLGAVEVRRVLICLDRNRDFHPASIIKDQARTPVTMHGQGKGQLTARPRARPVDQFRPLTQSSLPGPHANRMVEA